jgi:glycosyltransferase involved in cell wall biosynthesis
MSDAATASSLRLAIVLSHPTQYYSPWFQWLRTHTDLEFRVFYLWAFGVTENRDPQFQTTFKWDVNLLSGYESEFVPNCAADPGTHHFRGLDNPTLTARLAAWRPHAVLLFGYKWTSHLRVVVWTRLRGISLVFRGDSHNLGRVRQPFIHRLLLGWLFRQFAAITYVGRANHDYFRSLGVPPAKLFFAPHSVEHTRFDPADPTARATAQAVRERLRLGNRRTVLFAGKLQERKQPAPLLRAFLSIATDDDALVFVGDGPERSLLEEIARRRPGVQVHFLPFANQTQMPGHYLLADIFALPSHGAYETWGLAVNEAMHLGLPCLVSDLVGCQRDLVQSDQTGWVFPADDHAILARILHAALRTSATDLARLGQNARRLVSGYTYEQTTAGLLQALTSLAAFRTAKQPF